MALTGKRTLGKARQKSFVKLVTREEQIIQSRMKKIVMNFLNSNDFFIHMTLPSCQR